MLARTYSRTEVKCVEASVMDSLVVFSQKLYSLKLVPVKRLSLGCDDLCGPLSPPYMGLLEYTRTYSLGCAYLVIAIALLGTCVV